MTAERVAVIREAVDLMRRRAEAASPGEWIAVVGKGAKRRRQQYALVGLEHMRGQGEAGCLAVLAGLNEHRADDAEHIVGWQPDVGREVADWLEHEAKHAALGWTRQSDHAYSVARTYLRRPA